MVYVGIYALIYLHTILGEGIVSRDGLPRGVLPSGILKIEKYCPGLKVRSPNTKWFFYRSPPNFVAMSNFMGPALQNTWTTHLNASVNSLKLNIRDWKEKIFIL